jgi:alkyl hydroperoxide reductase subunit AhpC
MTLRLGDLAPDFQADTTDGRISFHDWLGGAWALLFSHPKDFTPVCTTELAVLSWLEGEFTRRGVKLLGLSVDPVASHVAWAADIRAAYGRPPGFPIVGDTDFAVAKRYGMLPADASGDPLQRTAAQNQTVRCVFLIGPDRRIKAMLAYPMTTGRSFDELLRLVDSVQLTAAHPVATPADWQAGEEVLLAGSLSDEEARARYPEGWRQPRPYVRLVPQPA